MTAIAVTGGPAGPTLDGELEAGSQAFVDADWILRSSGESVPALLAREGRMATSWDDRSIDCGAQAEVRVAADTLAGVAFAAAEIASAAGGPIAVPGQGLVANLVRALLAGSLVREGERPLVVVETRAGAQSLLASSRQVADRGTIVLAIQPGGAFAFDLYPDVHVRALRVLGAPLPLAAPPATHPDPPAPRATSLGQPIPGEGEWFLVTPDRSDH